MYMLDFLGCFRPEREILISPSSYRDGIVPVEKRETSTADQTTHTTSEHKNNYGTIFKKNVYRNIFYDVSSDIDMVM